MKRSLKNKKSKTNRKKRISRKKNRIQKGGQKENNTKKLQLTKQYFDKVKNYIVNTPILEMDKLDLLFKKANLQSGIVYDFILKQINSKNFVKASIQKSDISLIWNHGIKPNIEKFTAGMPGLHVYVQKNNDSLELVGIVLNARN